jgi:hypothetical protein
MRLVLYYNCLNTIRPNYPQHLTNGSLSLSFSLCKRLPAYASRLERAWHTYMIHEGKDILNDKAHKDTPAIGSTFI